MNIDTKKLCIFSIFGANILFILMLVYVWGFTIDDTFISFRYSEHLANGFGLVWNISQPPVEGYSNFLWVLMVAFLLLLKLDPIFSTKIIGLLSVLGITILFWFITNDILKDKKNKFTAFTISTFLLLISPYTVIHAVSGMETMFYAFLLLGVLYSTWKIIINSSSNFIWLFAFTALLLSLTRPEGAIISLALIFTIIYISYWKNRNLLKLTYFLPFLVLYLIPIITYNVFRISYFHEIFPLPFLVKIVKGYTYPADFISALIYLAPFIIIILISYYVMNQKNEPHKQQKTYFEYFLLVLGIVFFFANIEYVSTPIMNFSHRFFYPSFVMVYVAFGIAISILFHEIAKNKPNRNLAKFKRIALTSVLILILVFSNVYGINDLKSQHDYEISFNHSYIAIGDALSPFSSDNYTVAFADAGAVAYLSGWNFLDLAGLNDKYIKDNGVTTEYLKQNSPEIVILASYNGVIVNFGSIYEYVLQNNYTRLKPIKHNDYYFIPFLKPKIKDYESIKNSLERVSRESNQ